MLGRLSWLGMQTSLSGGANACQEKTQEITLPNLLSGATYCSGKVQQGWNKLSNISKSLNESSHPVEEHCT